MITRKDLHVAFKVVMDKNSQSTAFGGAPAFLDAEIDYWLNQAMFQLVSTKFTGHNMLQQPFEGSVKRIQDLEKLVKTDKGIEAPIEENSNKIIITDLLQNQAVGEGRMFFVNAVIHWNQPDNLDVIKRKPAAIVQMIDHKIANRFLETFNNKPWIDTPVATIEDNSLQIYVDTATTNAPYTVDITYVKYPTKIENLGPEGLVEIPEYMRYELINTAVQLALENIESRRIETKSQINNLAE